MDPKTVLVVAAETDDRERYGGWLEDEGFQVLSCPGPQAPSYTCVGGRKGTCALGRAADIVLLDAALPGDDLHQGTSAAELVTLYAALGKPVVAVTALARDVTPPAEWLRAPPSREDLVAAVRAV